LILVSKVLQSLSNATLFGEKEDYMKALNESLAQHQVMMERISTTFDGLSAHESAKGCKSEQYYRAADLLQQSVLSHQHSISPLLPNKEAVEEFQEALNMFSSTKAQEIMRNVTQELRQRNGSGTHSIKRMLSPRGRV
jgi:hypothetical protein